MKCPVYAPACKLSSLTPFQLFFVDLPLVIYAVVVITNFSHIVPTAIPFCGERAIHRIGNISIDTASPSKSSLILFTHDALRFIFCGENINFSIPFTSTVPSQSGSLTYNGSAQTPTFSNYDTNKMTLSVTGQTNAGTYSASFTPKDDYMWSDETTAAKTVNWTINKAAGSLSVSPQTVTLDMEHPTAQITVTRPGDGAITAVSNNTGIVTVSVSGNVITVNNVNQTSGDTTITVKVAAGTNYTAPANKTVTVNAEFVSDVLNETSWAVIKAVSDSGQGDNYWDVGDTKTITINGKIGTTNFSSVSIDAFIAGFNHNSSREGSNRIHFIIGKKSGKMVGLFDSKYGPDAGWPSGGSGSFVMNTSSTNSGGWNNSYMRKTILGNSNTPSNPLANSFIAALPADLRAVMKSVTKYTDNTANGGGNQASYITATTDYLWLLAEFEVQGARTYANSYEQNYQAQYQYFKSGNSKVAYKYNATGT